MRSSVLRNQVYFVFLDRAKPTLSDLIQSFLAYEWPEHLTIRNTGWYGLFLISSMLP